MHAGNSDDELLAQAIEGDREALAALLQRHALEMRRRLAEEIGARWRSLVSEDDVPQESFTDAFLDFRGFVPRGPGSFEAWLWTLARRNLLDVVRLLEAQKRGGDRRRVEASGEESSIALLDEIGLSATPSRDAMAAERLGRSAPTVCMLRHRALRCLRQLLGSTGGFFSTAG